MYYGNPSAASESNPDNTFDLFVDFTRDGVTSYGGSQDTNPSQWEIIDDTTLRMWGNNWKCVMKTLDVAGMEARQSILILRATEFRLK